MLSRKISNMKPTRIPQDWLDEVNAVLNETYQQQCSHLNVEMETFGEIYKDELCIAFSLIDKNNKFGKAITLFTSADLDDKSEPKKVFDYIFNSSSEFYDYIFDNKLEDGEIYQAKWEQTKLPNLNFFYKISRENLNTTKKANELLAED